MDLDNYLSGNVSYPPAMVEVLGADAIPEDVGYELYGSFFGVKGTWHRLWMALIHESMFPGPDSTEMVHELRIEFEGLYGRLLTQVELAGLKAHAHHHCETVMFPMMRRKFPHIPVADA